MILVDQFPDEDEEFVEFEAPAIEPVPEEALPNGSIPNGHATTGTESGPHIWMRLRQILQSHSKYVGGFLILSSVADRYLSTLSIMSIKVWARLYNCIHQTFLLRPFTCKVWACTLCVK